jgi:hypothetical protein
LWDSGQRRETLTRVDCVQTGIRTQVRIVTVRPSARYYYYCYCYYYYYYLFCSKASLNLKIVYPFQNSRNRCGSFNIVTRLTAGKSRNRIRISSYRKIYLLRTGIKRPRSIVFRVYRRYFCRENRIRGVRLTKHL